MKISDFTDSNWLLIWLIWAEWGLEQQVMQKTQTLPFPVKVSQFTVLFSRPQYLHSFLNLFFFFFYHHFDGLDYNWLSFCFWPDVYTIFVHLRSLQEIHGCQDRRLRDWQCASAGCVMTQSLRTPYTCSLTPSTAGVTAGSSTENDLFPSSSRFPFQRSSAAAYEYLIFLYHKMLHTFSLCSAAWFLYHFKKDLLCCFTFYIFFSE